MVQKFALIISVMSFSLLIKIKLILKKQKKSVIE